MVTRWYTVMPVDTVDVTLYTPYTRLPPYLKQEGKQAKRHGIRTEWLLTLEKAF